MKIETYLKAKRLYKDMDRLRALIRDTENGKGGIRVTTYLYKDLCLSNEFQKSLVEFIKKKLQEYEKEFDELEEVEDEKREE